MLSDASAHIQALIIPVDNLPPACLRFAGAVLCRALIYLRVARPCVVIIVVTEMQTAAQL